MTTRTLPRSSQLPQARSTTPAMSTPWFDAFCVGGGSIVLALVILLFDLRVPARETTAMMVIAYLLNTPHFMASYQLLYGAKDRLREYKEVSLFMPMALLVYMVFALSVYGSNAVYLQAMFGTGIVLLAWHYTGQAWGMMASFGYIEGFRFSPLERRLVRTNLYVLLAWHVVWAIVNTPPLFNALRGAETVIDAGLVQRLYGVMSLVGLFSSLGGLAALVLLARRCGRVPTLRMLLPWVAIHLWYVLMYQQPLAIFWVQIAHALQYLIFPMRVQVNRGRRKGGSSTSKGTVLKYYALLFVLGVLVLGVLPDVVQLVFKGLNVGSFTTVDTLGKSAMTLAVVGFVNIHHYFTDNVIWKIRNPIVRDDLFSHLSRT